MRSTAELLQILLDNINELRSGLCHLIYHLVAKQVISYAEGDKVYEYIYDHRPNAWRNDCDNYWWHPGWKRPRKRWLKKQIKIMS